MAQGPDAEHPDRLPDGPARGRGAGLNPANRFEGIGLAPDGDHLDEAHEPDGKQYGTRVIPERARSALNPVDPRASPDVGFRWTLNPYRGCEHGCVYCYARPNHEQLGESLGLDFETRIRAKVNAPELLRRELRDPAWRPEPVVMGGVTDVYQPAERHWRVTRGCLEVFAEASQPVSVVTKSRLVARDADLLAALAGRGASSVAVSVTTLDPALAASLEPRAGGPRQRLAAIEALADAGVPVTVMVAPVIPGLTDSEVPEILRAAKEAGASAAGYVLLRLPHGVKDLFLDWLRRVRPERAQRVAARIRETRGGALYDPTSGKRMRGEGPMAEHLERVVGLFRRRLGLERPAALAADAFEPPAAPAGEQMRLF